MQPFFDKDHGRLRTPWRLLLQDLLYKYTLPLFLNLLAATYLLAAAGGGGSGLQSLPGSPALPLIGSVASFAAVCSSVWLAGRFLDRRPFADFGFRLSRGWWFDLCFGLALGAFLMTAIFLAELGLGWVSVSGLFAVSDAFAESGAPFALAMLVPLGICSCVGFSEELLFRGYQIKNAAEGLYLPALGPRGAVIVAWLLSSAFFGYLHADNPNATPLATFNIALAGLMLGLGYVLTGELAIPIGLHITWNLFQSSVYGFPVSGFDSLGASLLDVEQSGPALWTGGPFGPEAGLLGVAAVLLGALLIALWVRLRRGRVAIHAPLAEAPKRVRPAQE